MTSNSTGAAADTGSAALSLSNVAVQFNVGNAVLTACKDISLEIEEGRFITLIGPSGCGKSTLLRAIADILPCATGDIRIFGRAPSACRQDRRISFVFQDATLLPWRTVHENITLPTTVGGWKAKGRPARSPSELIDLVSLTGREDALPYQLSGGMRQRVAIARALITNPNVLLMDEPFGALDEITRDGLNEEMLRVWSATKSTIIFVTHSLEEAAYLGEKVVVMAPNPGRIAEVIDLTSQKPGNRIDKSSSEFFNIISHLRAVLSAVYAEGGRA